jgi:hypothetical protein
MFVQSSRSPFPKNALQLNPSRLIPGHHSGISYLKVFAMANAENSPVNKRKRPILLASFARTSYTYRFLIYMSVCLSVCLSIYLSQ